MDLLPAVENAMATAKLLESSAANIRLTLAGTSSPIAAQSITELVEAGEWTELNDRFYRALAFGTGGIRGRTIGKFDRCGVL
jgi:phosphoglucomutase